MVSLHRLVHSNYSLCIGEVLETATTEWRMRLTQGVTTSSFRGEAVTATALDIPHLHKMGVYINN